jgi:hypothetical protein
MRAVEVLSKVTGLTQGLFNEISSKTRGMLPKNIFECQAESDEYEVLLNQKNEVLQIKNAYTTWDKDIINSLITEPVPQPAQPKVQANLPQLTPNVVNTLVLSTLLDPSSLSVACSDKFAKEAKECEVTLIKYYQDYLKEDWTKKIQDRI